MTLMKPAETIAGVAATPPKLKIGAAFLALVWIGLPVVGVLSVLDLALWSAGLWPYN